MKKILFDDELVSKIKDNDPKFSIELIKNVIETSLNLRKLIEENNKKCQEFKPELLDPEQDYILLIHKYEIDIKDLKNVIIIHI